MDEILIHNVTFPLASAIVCDHFSMRVLEWNYSCFVPFSRLPGRMWKMSKGFVQNAPMDVSVLTSHFELFCLLPFKLPLLIQRVCHRWDQPHQTGSNCPLCCWETFSFCIAFFPRIWNRCFCLAESSTGGWVWISLVRTRDVLVLRHFTWKCFVVLRLGLKISWWIPFLKINLSLLFGYSFQFHFFCCGWLTYPPRSNCGDFESSGYCKVSAPFKVGA